MRPERCGRSKLSLDRRGQPAEKAAGQTHVVAQDDPVNIRNVRHGLDIASRRCSDNKAERRCAKQKGRRCGRPFRVANAERLFRRDGGVCVSNRLGAQGARGRLGDGKRPSVSFVV